MRREISTMLEAFGEYLLGLVGIAVGVARISDQQFVDNLSEQDVFLTGDIVRRSACRFWNWR